MRLEFKKSTQSLELIGIKTQIIYKDINIVALEYYRGLSRFFGFGEVGEAV
jgi:hypothetical protein